MKKYIILISLSVLSISCLQAQLLLSPFVRGGVTFPSFSLDNRNFNTSSIVGFHGGVGTLVDVSSLSFELEPSLQLAMRGTKIKSDLGSQSLSLLYLDIPLMVNLPLTIGQTGVFAGIGGMVSYALMGWEATGSAKSRRISLSEKLGNRFDLSARVHGGLRIYGHQLSLFYERGFVNLSSTNAYAAYNNGWGILYGYIF